MQGLSDEEKNEIICFIKTLKKPSLKVCPEARLEQLREHLDFALAALEYYAEGNTDPSVARDVLRRIEG